MENTRVKATTHLISLNKKFKWIKSGEILKVWWNVSKNNEIPNAFIFERNPNISNDVIKMSLKFKCPLS